MSSESKLQKQFQEKDINRMRSLVTGDYNAQTTTQTGYTKQHQERVEGEIWQENNKTWTMRNGIKMSVPKFNKIKHLTVLPLICPSCSKPIQINDLNKKMYSQYSKCFDCVIEYETKLKSEGNYENHQKEILNTNLNSYIQELEEEFRNFLINNNDDYVTEEGDVEKWVGGNVSDATKTQIEEYISKLKSNL